MIREIWLVLFGLALVSTCIAFPNPLQRSGKPKIVRPKLKDHCKGDQYILFGDDKAPFYSCYSIKHNGPIWTVHLLDQYGLGRRGETQRPPFWSVPQQLKGRRNGGFIESYRGVSLNRGHLVPRGDISEKGKTDTVINGIPQVADMNARYWRCVEHSLRRMAQGLRARLLVITVPVYGATQRMGSATQDKPRTYYTIERDMIRTEKTAVEIPIAVTKIAYRFVERTPKAAVCVTLTNVGTVDQLPNEYPVVEDWKTCMHSATMKQTGLAGHLHKPANQNARGLKENLLFMLDPRKLDQVTNEEVPCPEDPAKWQDVQ